MAFNNPFSGLKAPAQKLERQRMERHLDALSTAVLRQMLKDPKRKAVRTKIYAELQRRRES